MTLSVGQIGLGTIGALYAGHLLDAEARLKVYDVERERCVPLAERGAEVAEDVRGVVDGVDYVLVSLPNPDADREVLLGADGALASARPGVLFLDVSTIDPATARELYDAARGLGVAYVEAPVSGGEPLGAGTEGARAANITFMAGGDKAAFERARPLMEILGKHFLYLGSAGTGSTIKLISNQISGLHNLVAAEAFALGRAAGIDPETLFEVFEHTDASSYWLFNYFAPRIRGGDFVPGFSVDLQYKDHRLTEDLARKLKVPMPFNGLAMQIYQILRARGDGGKDLVEAANLMAELAGTRRYDDGAAGDPRSKRAGTEVAWR
jgi:3-hydroxyisobutyrate dehydrogenase-like beta-hydroxyacid dehydrogenase